uniref:Protein NDRG3 n=1 Tax=Mesocestoides corti TaxID=53468 RepID=A0A5K3EKB5_MESCO
HNGTGFPNNRKPESHVRRRPSESTTLTTPLIIYHFSNAIGTQRDRELAEASVVQNVRALIRRYATLPLTH